jgi:hypothetical protein
MVFGKLAELFASAENRFLSSNASNVSNASPRLPFSLNSIRSYNKNNLRISSSLQDLSAYTRIDPEENCQNLNPNSETPILQTNPHPLLSENKGGVTFSKEKSSPRTPLLRKKWVRILILLFCLLLSVFFIYTLQIFYSNWSEGASKFYVILDCGSTGTRVYIYKAAINQNKDGTLPILVKSIPEVLRKKRGSQRGRAYNRMETEPGFDKLVHNLTGLKGAIKPLLKWAEKQIPKRSHKNTSLFLYATAGVRRLAKSDSDWLLDSSWIILKNSSFSCERESVKIISGMEEAYYGWIALNYDTGVLGSAPSKETFGSLDLGGSSLQVTFENKNFVQNKTSLKLRIGPVNHLLTAYSLSGYGLNDAFDKSVIQLVKKLPKIKKSYLASGKVVIKHPCLQSGYKSQYVCSQCTSLLEGKMGKERKPGILVKLIGAPNWEECRVLAKVAVNYSEWSGQNQSQGVDCDLQPCALPDNVPRPLGHFHGISGFYVVYKFFNLTSDSALEDVLEKGQEFCEKKWDVAKKSVAPQPFIEQYCFRAPYIVYLLRYGLHITDSNLFIGSGSVTWTLGVALLEAGKAFSSKGVEAESYEIFWMKINPYIIFAILVVTLIFLIVVLSRVGNWTPKFFRRPHLPLFRSNSATSSSVLNLPSPFRFQRWSPINLGDRVKMPLSPVASAQHRQFGNGHGFSGLQLTETSLYSSSSSNVSHSYSSGSLGQIQFENSTTGSFRSPHRSQMHLQSRRSQSREDLYFQMTDSVKA